MANTEKPLSAAPTQYNIDPEKQPLLAQTQSDVSLPQHDQPGSVRGSMLKRRGYLPLCVFTLYIVFAVAKGLILANCGLIGNGDWDGSKHADTSIKDDWVIVPGSATSGLGAHGAQKNFGVGRRVALEAHIMSKCPDARDCLRDMILPAMQNVSDKVDFTLSYIGQLHSNSDEDETVTCKHGESECLGNIIELCAAELYPDPMIYLGFTMCMSESYSHIPDRSLIQECALEHGVDFALLSKCAEDEEGTHGMDLLRQSVARSEQHGVVKSCTVRLDDEIRCIRDGGEWKDCPEGSSAEELVRDIVRAAAKQESME